MKNVKQYKVVTTGKRGVFFGIVKNKKKDSLDLHDAQMCVYWSSDVRGVLGLASSGPNKNCRITKAIPKIELNEITSVMDVTEEAYKNWKECFWG